MSRRRQDIINDYLENPQKMLLKRPFFRGSESIGINDPTEGCNVKTNQLREAELPDVNRRIVSQERFMRELDPNCHNVIFDNNLPSICVKLEDGSYSEIQFKRFGIPMQRAIMKAQTLYLAGNKRVHILHDSNPSDTLKKNFADFKWHWLNDNMDGVGYRAVKVQKSFGDVGVLMYMNEKNEIKSRIFSYEDGYQVIPHKDDNGEPLLDCVYYKTSDGVRHIDAYDDTNHYHFSDYFPSGNDGGENTKSGWYMDYKEEHGFNESPLITKRGAPACDNGEDLIELFEIIYNLFAVIQKRHGWGILYIKGKFNETAKKIAGSVILNDTSVEGNGSAEFKTPPSPQNMIDFMQAILDQIQIATGATFILPKDIKSSGDVSGLAIQMTRSLDIVESSDSVIEWQNFASKMSRLYKEGLAKQLVSSGENPTAITDFAKMKVSTSFKPWQPFDESTWNQMLCTMKGAGVISTKTAVEKNTISAPDEEVRLQKEQEIASRLEALNSSIEQSAQQQIANLTNESNNE